MAKQWTAEERDYLRTHYPTTDTGKVSESLGRPRGGVVRMAHLMGVSKCPEFMRTNRGRFQKGQKPWNTGMALAGTGRVKYKCNFEKGNITWNTREVGAMRFNKRDGWQIKTAEPNVWTQYARYVWEQEVGAIPRGYVVRLKDGNKNNVVIGNLACIPRGANMTKNSLSQWPSDLSKAIRAISKLNKMVNENASSKL